MSTPSLQADSAAIDMVADVAAVARSYDNVPYESKPFAQSHPAQIAAIAKLFGRSPAAMANARVLEIGCASGGNLVPLAANYPQMQVVGIELSPKQSEVGREWIKDLGLPNARIITGDVTQYATLLEPGAKFDYILCHGVFSWVPVPVQAGILQAIGDLLADEGVAYVSYNVYPGWKLREVLREMMVFHAGGIEDPVHKLQQGRAIVEYIRNISDQNTAFGKLLSTESELILKGSDYYIHHEFLEINNRPVYFKDFITLAAAQGLAFLGEANFSEMAPQRLGPQIHETLNRLSNGNVLATEQYMDLFTNRFFRQTLLVKSDAANPVNRSLSPASVKDLYFMSSLQHTALDTTVQGQTPLASYKDKHGRSLSATAPLSKMVLDELVAANPRPVAFADIVSRVVSKAVSAPPANLDPVREQIGQQLLQFLVQGVVTVMLEEVSPVVGDTAKPLAFAPAQLLAARQAGWVPTRFHQAQSLNIVEQALLALMDGTRDEAALVSELLEGFKSDKYSAHRDGQKITDPQQLRAAIEGFVKGAVQGFDRHGLLAGS